MAQTDTCLPRSLQKQDLGWPLRHCHAQLEPTAHPGHRAGAATGGHHPPRQRASAHGYTGVPGPWGSNLHPPRPPARTTFQVVMPTQSRPGLFTLQSIRVITSFSRNSSFRRAGWLGSYSPVGTHIGGFSHGKPTAAFQRQAPLRNNVIYFLYSTRFDVRIFLIWTFCFFSQGHRSVLPLGDL